MYIAMQRSAPENLSRFAHSFSSSSSLTESSQGSNWLKKRIRCLTEKRIVNFAVMGQVDGVRFDAINGPIFKSFIRRGMIELHCFSFRSLLVSAHILSPLI